MRLTDLARGVGETIFVALEFLQAEIENAPRRNVDQLGLPQHLFKRVAAERIRRIRRRHFLPLEPCREIAELGRGAIVGGGELLLQRGVANVLEGIREIVRQKRRRAFGHLDGGFDVGFGQRGVEIGAGCREEFGRFAFDGCTARGVPRPGQIALFCVNVDVNRLRVGHRIARVDRQVVEVSTRREFPRAESGGRIPFPG